MQRHPKLYCFALLCKDVQTYYVGLRKLLGAQITEPAGLPVNLIKFRFLDIFTAGSKAEMRKAVATEFCCSDTKLRLIIATSAFGLGIDCSDITQIIHWGHPTHWRNWFRKQVVQVKMVCHPKLYYIMESQEKM